MLDPKPASRYNIEENEKADLGIKIAWLLAYINNINIRSAIINNN